MENRKCKDCKWWSPTILACFYDANEGMKIAYEAGQVSEETAFSKKWHNIKMNLTDKELTDWDIADTEKYNKLFSEDLY